MKGLLRKVEKNRYIIYVYIAFCTVAIALTCSDNPLDIGNIGTDSAVFNYMARLILTDGMPYRDSFDHKGPLIYLIDAIGQSVNNDIGVWIIELVFLGVSLLFAYKVARLLGCGNKRSVVLIGICVLSMSFYLDGGNTTEEYACTFIMISLYIFLKYFTKKNVNSIEIVVCGIAFGAVCFLRINMAVLWLVMCIGVVVECLKEKQIRRFFKYAYLFIIGTAAITFPIIIWLIRNDSFQPFLDDYLKFNILYTSDSERASLYNITQSFGRFLLDGPALLSLMIITYFGLKKRGLVDWLCEAVLIVSLISMCISGQAYDHYGMILVPVVIYAFSRLLAEIDFTIKKYTPCVIVGLGIFLLCYMKGFKRFTIEMFSSGKRTEIDEIVYVIKNNTNESDRISVCGNNNIIYLKSERFSSSVYSYQDPIANVDVRIKEKYIKDIQSLSARIIIIDETSLWHYDIDFILKEKYQKIKQINTTEIYILDYVE